jgi:hypothetical protein
VQPFSGQEIESVFEILGNQEEILHVAPLPSVIAEYDSPDLPNMIMITRVTNSSPLIRDGQENAGMGRSAPRD